MPKTRIEYEITTMHGPISGPLLGGVAAVFLSMAGRLFPHLVPDWLPIALATMMILIAWAVGSKKKTPPSNIAFRSVCWAVFAGWTYVAIHIGFKPSLIMFGLLALIASGFLMGLFKIEEVTTANQVVNDASRRMTEAEYIAHLIAKRLSLPQSEPVNVTKLEDWPGKTGTNFFVEGSLGSSFTWQKLAGICDDIAAGLRLPAGCSVSAHPTDRHLGTALLRVTRVNESHLPVPLARPGRPVSVNDAVNLGRHPDRRPTDVSFRQNAVIVVGKRGAGKTVTLHTITAELAYCYDTLIWHVDLNGGGMSAPWVKLGRVVDWAAPTPREALLLAAAATAIAVDRKSRYQSMMIAHKTDILPVGNGVTICGVCNEAHPPQITILVDEGGEVTGDEVDPLAKVAGEELRKLQRLGRAVGVNMVLSVQRGTADYLPSQVKKAIDVVIALRVKDDSEYAYAFDSWTSSVSPRMLVHNGMGWIQQHQGPIELFRGSNTQVVDIEEVSRETETFRPVLDRGGVYIAGDLYAGRWDRSDVANWTARLHGMIGDDFEEVAPLTVEGVLAGDRGGNSSAPRSSVGLMASIVEDGERHTPATATTAVASPRPAEPQSVPAQRREYSPAEMDDIIAQMERELDDLDADADDPDGVPQRPVAGQPAEPAPEPRKMMSAAERMLIRREEIIAFVASKGSDGAKTEEIIEHIRVSGLLGNREATVKEDLTKLCEAKAVVRGKYAMYYTPENAPAQ